MTVASAFAGAAATGTTHRRLHDAADHARLLDGCGDRLVDIGRAQPVICDPPAYPSTIASLLRGARSAEVPAAPDEPRQPSRPQPGPRSTPTPPGLAHTPAGAAAGPPAGRVRGDRAVPPRPPAPPRHDPREPGSVDAALRLSAMADRALLGRARGTDIHIGSATSGDGPRRQHLSPATAGTVRLPPAPVASYLDRLGRRVAATLGAADIAPLMAAGNGVLRPGPAAPAALLDALDRDRLDTRPAPEATTAATSPAPPRPGGPSPPSDGWPRDGVPSAPGARSAERDHGPPVRRDGADPPGDRPASLPPPPRDTAAVGRLSAHAELPEPPVPGRPGDRATARPLPPGSPAPSGAAAPQLGHHAGEEDDLASRMKQVLDAAALRYGIEV